MPLILPCRHKQRVTEQVQPTINLLTNMEALHPDLLLEHNTEPSRLQGWLGRIPLKTEYKYLEMETYHQGSRLALDYK